MKVVITGTSCGIGRACAMRFLQLDHEVYGIDILPSTIDKSEAPRYHHYIADVADYDTLPDIYGVEILINNAGVQDSGHDIETNLKGVINCTKKYGLQPQIYSILNQASVSAHNGAEFPEYVASKGGVLAYTKHIAQYVAEKYAATCNSLSFGGVTTPLNDPVMKDEECWKEIMNVTPLKKWVTAEEAATWVYFFTVLNRSCTGQDLIIDNGESILTHFVWK